MLGVIMLLAMQKSGTSRILVITIGLLPSSLWETSHGIGMIRGNLKSLYLG